MIFIKNAIVIIVWFFTSYLIFLLQPLQNFESYILSLMPEDYKFSLDLVEKDELFELYHLYTATEEDTALSAYVKIPNDSLNYPSIIILGGMMTGKEAVNYAYGVNNVVLAAPDYRYKPRYEYDFTAILSDILDGYHATFYQVVDNLLLIDFLHSWERTKHQKISLLGYSFGVPFAAATTALTQNIDYLAMVYGGADLHYLIQHNLNLFNPFIDEILTNVFWLHLIAFEPAENLEQLSPMPTLIINGSNDEKIPEKSAKKLQDAIQFEKTVIWIDSRHVHPANKKLSLKIIDDLNNWYQKNDFFN